MKRVIIYYSYTNHTKMICDMIGEELDCDIFCIKTKNEEELGYQELVDKYENNEIEKPIVDIENLSINLNDYDEIILGTPVWWYSIPPSVRAFLSNYDLSGKIVIPFATNAGWLGSTFQEIKSLCKNSTVKCEMNIVFTSDYKNPKLVTSRNKIYDWIKEL